MDWEQKLEALKALGDCTLNMRKPGNWYVSQPGVEIKEGDILSGAYGNGVSPEVAVCDHWQKRAQLSGDRYLVIGASRENRRAVRWNGFMWADVTESDT
jgi:hypothetical protein